MKLSRWRMFRSAALVFVFPALLGSVILAGEAAPAAKVEIDGDALKLFNNLLVLVEVEVLKLKPHTKAALDKGMCPRDAQAAFCSSLLVGRQPEDLRIYIAADLMAFGIHRDKKIEG